MKFALVPILVLALINASTADEDQYVARPEEPQHHHHHHHHNPAPVAVDMDQNQPGPTTPKSGTTAPRVTGSPEWQFSGGDSSVSTTSAPGFFDRLVGTIKGIEATIGGGIEHKFNAFFEIIGSIVRWIYNGIASVGNGILNGINWKGETIERLVSNLFQKGHSVAETIAEPMDFLGTMWNMLAPLAINN